MRNPEEILNGVIKGTELTKAKAQLAIVVGRKEVFNELYSLVSEERSELLQLFDQYDDDLDSNNNQDYIQTKINLEDTEKTLVVHVNRLPEEVSDYLQETDNFGRGYLLYKRRGYTNLSILDRWLGDIKEILIIGL